MQKLFLSNDFFKPVDTFECGQCFRWTPYEKGYRGVVGTHLLEVMPEGKGYVVRSLAKHEDPIDLYAYFDEEVDYEQVVRVLSKQDDVLAKAVPHGQGIRLLNQDPFEMLITFMISSNNNIQRIRQSVDGLAKAYGDEMLAIDGSVYYTFPRPEQLKNVSSDAYRALGLGYRDRAVEEAVQRIVLEKIDLLEPFLMGTAEAKAWLKTFKGIGDKVANCILLFAYQKKEVFPIDTWVKRVVRELYDIKGDGKAEANFVEKHFTLYGGYAQQYLFYYMRSKKR